MNSSTALLLGLFFVGLVVTILLLWFSCWLVKQGVIKDSPFLIIVAVFLGGLIPLFYYFICKDKIKRKTQETEKTKKS